MKIKTLLLSAMCIISLAGMTGCECKHESWTEANCTTAKTCEECGATEGEPLGHDWKEADCENPKTCEVCGETEGESLEHKWIDADCENPKTCELCGETEGEQLGHSTTKGKCSNCSEYILEDAFIPDENDFADCIGLSTIPSTYTYSFSNSTSTGFDMYFSIPASQRIDGCEDLGWDVCLGYVGTVDFNILSTYIMNYVPEDQNNLTELYNAIIDEMNNRYGKASSGEAKWNRKDAEIEAFKVNNGVSITISLK